MANTAFTHDPTITVPSPTVNNRVVTWNGTTGKVFDNVATVTINAGVVAGVTALTVDDLTIDGTSITTIASNNDINITPHGTGATVITKLKITASAGASKVLTSDSAGVATWEAAAASGVSNPLTSGSFVLNDNAKLGLGTSSGESAIYSDGTNVYWDTGDDVPIIFRDVTTNSTTKASRIGFGHYTNSEEPVMMMSGNSISSGNALYIGGGRNNMNAVTSIDFYTAANGTTTGGTSRLLIDSEGIVSLPAQPCVAAYNSGIDSNVTGGGQNHTVDLDTEVFDQGGDFADDTFTAPYVGKYIVHARSAVGGLTADMSNTDARLIASNRSWYGDGLAIGVPRNIGNGYAIGVSAIIDMDANDTVRYQITVAGGSQVADQPASGAGDLETFMCIAKVV